MAEKEVKIKITIDDQGSVRKFEQLGKKAKQAGEDIESAGQKASKGINSINNSLDVLVAGQVGEIIGNIASGIVKMGVASIKAASQMRQYEIAFGTMLKSASKGKAMLQDLQKFAARTPFDVPGVVTAAQQLMAFGFQAEEIIPILTSLGDAAAGLGKGTAGVQQLAYALGQMKTSGTLKTQDINQLTNAGIDAWRILADATGKSITEIKELTEKGMIDSVKAVDVLVEGINSRFGGMMAKTSNEVAGLVSNVQESLGTAQATIGAFLTDSLKIKSVLADMSDAIGGVSDSLQKARDEGKTFREALMEAFSPAVLNAIGAVATVIGVTLVAGLVAAAGAFATFAGISAPVVAACVAIGVAVSEMIQHWDDITTAINNAYNALIRYINLVKKRYFGEFTGTEYESDDIDGINVKARDDFWKAATKPKTQVPTEVPVPNTTPANTPTNFVDIFTQGNESIKSGLTTQKEQVDQVTQAWRGYAESLSGGFGNAVGDMLAGSKTIAQALGDMLRSVLRNAAQMAAQFLMLSTILRAFGVANAGNVAVQMMFGIDPGKIGSGSLKSHNMGSYKNSFNSNGMAFAFADGGFVSGAGTSTSDSIPARLSNGEYVVRASAVRKVGLPMLNAINYGYASGGLVGSAAYATNAPSIGSSNSVTLSVSTLDASSFEGFLQGGGLDKIKQALFDNDRNFGAMAGVW